MAKPKSTKSFLDRGRARGSEQNKASVNGEEVKKSLQPATMRNYSRALAQWDQYKIEHPEATPQSIETSKDFVRCIAFGVFGGWQWKGNQKIDKMVTSTTSNFIKIVLQKELNLALRKRKRCYATMIHFVHLGTQLWQNDWLRYDRPGIRIEVWAEIQLHAFTAARIGEYVESTARPGSGRGLHFRDISFGVFRNEDGKAEFAMQVEKDAKGMTLTPDKRPQHALHEGREPRPLFWNPVLTHLAMFVGKGAFQDYETMEDLLDLEPLEKEMSRLEWDPSVLDTPLYRRKDGGIESAGVFGRRCRALGLRAGYERPPVIHDFRAEGLHTIDKLYSSTSRMQHGGHTSDRTYGEFYAPRNPGTDGQNSYLGDKPRTIVNDLFRGMTLSRNPELWQTLPAERQHELENSEEFLTIEEELAKLALKPEEGAAAGDSRRKELYVQKRKLVTAELRRCQRLQPRKLPSKVQKLEQIGHHRTQFSRTKQLMPERHRLAEGLFAIAPIRSEKGRAVLRDMIELYKQDTEVACRPGLEPEKCCCAVERRLQLDMFVPSPTFHEEPALTLYLNQETSPAESQSIS